MGEHDHIARLEADAGLELFMVAVFTADLRRTLAEHAAMKATLERISAGTGDYLAMHERDAKALARQALAQLKDTP